MDKYIIQPLKAPLPKLSGVEFSPETEPFCQAHGYAPIDNFCWDETGYKPEARAYVAWDEAGLHVLLCAKEATIRTAAVNFGGDVYKDSCLEAFLQFFPDDDARYANFETNAAGVAFIAFGTGRYDSKPLAEKPEGMGYCASKHAGAWWAVAYTIPMALIEKLYDGRKLSAGARMRGNFYKCDESIHPHFGSWRPIENPTPDFHRPEWFGEIELGK